MGNGILGITYLEYKKRKVGEEKMAKVSNETRLVISLFGERAKKRKKDMETFFGHSEESWAKGVIKGLEEAEKILAGIVTELERGYKL